MKSKYIWIKKAGFLILVFLPGLIFSAQKDLAKTRLNPDDAAIYAEVKSAIEKYGQKIASVHQPTAEDLQNNPVLNFDEFLSRCDLLITHNRNIPDYYRLRGKVRYYKATADGIYMFADGSYLEQNTYLAKFSESDLTAAIKDFSDALSANPNAKLGKTDASDAHLFRGKLYAISAAKNYSKQNLQNALIDFDAAVKLDDYIQPPDDFRKAIYLLSKDGDLVGQDFARRIRESPANSPQLYLERAGYYSVIVDYSKALADLLRYANSPNADKTVARTRYATLNKYAGDAYKRPAVSSAQDYLEKASLEIQFPQNVESAFNDATEAEKLNPRLTAAYIIRAKYLVGSGRVDEGVAEAYLALLQEPDNVGALCVRGLGLAIENNAASLDDFNRAIALDPELAFLFNAFGNRAKIYTALGKTDLADADIEKSQELAQKLAEIRK